MSPAPRIRLRPATLSDAELLDAWAASPEARGEFNDFGIVPDRSHAEMLAEGPMQDENHGELLVERRDDGQPLGSVSWHAVWNGPAGSRCWNIGISLVPDARGHGYGGEAQRMLADHLFATTDANRVEASTDVENAPEHRALLKAGFQREGTARGAQYRAGAYHDLVVYSRLRTDPA